MPNPDPKPAPKKPPLQVAKLLPPKTSAPAPKPKPKPKPPSADDAGFEVVDDDAVDTGTDTKALTETGFEVVDDDDPPAKPKPKKKPRVVVDDDDGEPAKGWGGDDDDDDRPRKKGKKKRRRDLVAVDENDEEKARERDNQLLEWGIPGFLTLAGIIMTIVAAVLISGKPDADGGGAAVSVLALLIASFIYTIIMIPVTIVALMVIGGVMGIEYGTLLNAVRSLTAITVLINGIYFLGGAFEFFGAVAAPAVATVLTFGLFMTLFKLDVFETWISLVGLNLLAYVGQLLFMLIVVLIMVKAAGKAGKGADFDPDDDGLVDPANKFDPAKFNGAGGGRKNRPFDPDGDDDN